MTVLEHIPAPEVREILGEAYRVLKLGGLAVHSVDPSDHFQHQDGSISRINFLKYGEKAWEMIAGNEFAYCNRLRAPQYAELVREAGLAVQEWDATVDGESLRLLKAGFPTDSQFTRFADEEVATTTLRFVATGA